MIVVEKNQGAKIPYQVEGTRITFADDLSINLAKREEDWPVHIDICAGATGELVIGAAAGRTYVAEIDIPARMYVDTEAPVAFSDGEETTQPQSEAVPLDMDQVALTLWAVE